MSTLYLAHHGIKGQKWGVRRFQNEDGTLTPAGRLRYGAEEAMIQVNRNTITKDKKGNRKYAGGGMQEAANVAAKVTSNVSAKEPVDKKEIYEKVVRGLEIIGGVAATATVVYNVAKKGKSIYDSISPKIGKPQPASRKKRYQSNYSTGTSYNGVGNKRWRARGTWVDAGTGGNRDPFDQGSFDRFFNTRKHRR